MRSVNSARARRSTSSNSGKLNVKRKKVRSTVMNIKNGKEKNKIVAKEQKLESAKFKKKKKSNKQKHKKKSTPQNCCISYIYVSEGYLQ